LRKFEVARSPTLRRYLGKTIAAAISATSTFDLGVTAFHMVSMRKLGKIVIVSQHYAPDPSTTASYPTAIAEGLQTDYEVLVISGTTHSASPHASGKPQPHVLELKTWTPEKHDLVRRAMAMMLFSTKVFFATLKHVRKDDVVLCVTTPFSLPYPVTLAAKLRKASVVLLIYDLYPEALVIAGLARPDSLVARALRFANNIMFGALDVIITIGRDVKVLLLTYKNVKSEKIRFVPNWALLPIGYRQISTTNPFRRGSANELIVGLSGNIGLTHDAGSVYEAARLLKDHKDIHFLLSGWGSGWEKLKERYINAPLENVTLVKRVPETELEEFLSAADVWIIPYRRNVAGVSVPSRIYNLLAIGRAIIVASEASSEAALILKENDIGWVTRPEDPLDLANAICSAAVDREATLAKGHRAAEVARLYTYDRAMASYGKIISELARARS
jgi:colanic acid biosynthesis glycosyl transferase WcaI